MRQKAWGGGGGDEAEGRGGEVHFRSPHVTAFGSSQGRRQPAMILEERSMPKSKFPCREVTVMVLAIEVMRSLRLQSE